MNDHLLASSFEDNTIRFANINETSSFNDTKFNYDLILNGGHTDFIQVIAKLNETILASGSCDNTIILWDIIKFKQIKVLKGHTNCINALINVEENYLISGSSDSTIKIWQNGLELSGYFQENAHQSSINALAFSGEKYSYIASGSDSIQIWFVDYLKFENKLHLQTNMTFTFLTILNKTFIVVSSLENVQIYNKTNFISSFNSKKKINVIKAIPNGNLAIGTNNFVEILNSKFETIQTLKHEFRVELLDVSQSSLSLITAQILNSIISIWDLETYKFKGNIYIAGFPINFLNFLPNDDIAGLFTNGNKTHLFILKYNLSYQKPIFNASFETHLFIQLKNASFVTISSLIEFKDYLITGHQDGFIKIWNLNSFDLKAKLKLYNSKIDGFEIIADLNDLNLISYSNYSLISVWNFINKLSISLKDNLKQNTNSPISALLFSNKNLISGSFDSEINVWEIDDNNFIFNTILNGHSNKITCLINVNNNFFASSSSDNNIIIWEQNKLLYTLKSHSSDINSIVFNPKYEILISGSMDGNTTLWQTTGNLTLRQDLKGVHLKQIQHTIVLDNDTIASASDDKTIVIWNIHTGMPKFHLKAHTDNINGLAKLSNDNLVSCSKDTSIIIWNKSDNYNIITTLYGHLRSVICLKTIDENRLASGSCDKKIIIWNIENNFEKIKEINYAHSDCINTLNVFQNYLLSGSDDKTLKIWNLTNYELIRALNQLSSVKSIATSSNKYFAHFDESKIIIHDDKGKRYSHFSTINTSNKTQSLAIMSNGNIVSGSCNNKIMIWNSTNFKHITSLEGHTDCVTSLVILFSTNEKIVSGSRDSTIKVWNSITYELIADLKKHTAPVCSLAVLDNGNIVSASEDKTIKVWNSISFEIIANLFETFIHHSNFHLISLAILHNGNIISGASNGRILAWNSTFDLIKIFHAHDFVVFSLAILPNGNIISGGGPSNKKDTFYIRVWNSTTFEQIADSDSAHSSFVTALTLLPNGYFASSSYDKTIKMWNSTYNLIYTLIGHENWILTLASLSNQNEFIISGSNDSIKIWKYDFYFDPVFNLNLKNDDSKLLDLKFLNNGHLATCYQDGTIKVWDIEKSKIIFENKLHNRKILALDVVKNTGDLVTCSEDKTIKIWDTNLFYNVSNIL